MRRVALCLALASLPGVARGHGDVHARIDALDQELALRPDDAALLIERGTLFATDRDWPLAVRDLEAARDLSPSSAGLGERLANALLHVGEVERAAALLDELIEVEPTSAEAHLLRGRARAHLGRLEEADRDFAEAIERSAKPSPQMYVDRVDALMLQGPASAEPALAVLESGAARLGPLVVFVERATEIEVARRRLDAALAWIDRLPAAARTAPDWRVRRARILVEDGKDAEAAREVDAGLAAIDALPPSRRDTQAIEALRAELLVVRAGLAAPEPARGDAWLWIVGAAGAIVAAALVLRRRGPLERAK